MSEATLKLKIISQNLPMIRCLKFLGICFVIFQAIYFRTVYLQSEFSAKSVRELASQHVRTELKKQLTISMDKAFVNIDEVKRNQLLEQEVIEVIEQDKKQYEESIKVAISSLKENIKSGRSRHYLLESDPYYYYYLVKQIEKEGTLSKSQKSGKFFDSKREWPRGAWVPKTWHPYLGYFWLATIRFFVPNVDTMEALCYFPLGLVVLSILAFFYLTKSLNLHYFDAWVASSALALSPIYIQRSSFGWFDTDPYQFIFPPIIIALSIQSFSGSMRKWMLLAAGFLTGIYALFWGGWFFVFAMLFMGFTLSGMVTRNAIWIYAATTLASSLIFMSPEGFYESVKTGLTFVQKFSLVDQDLWPNPFLTVGEAAPISIKKLLFLSGNPASASLCGLGLCWLVTQAVQKRSQSAILTAVIITIYLIGAAYEALKTERFSVLFVLPFSICVAFGIQGLSWILSRLLPRFKVAILALTALSLFSVNAVCADVSGRHNIAQIMNDTWFQSLEFLRDETPKESVVDSWWPPGYFIVAIGERKVLIDGGTQQLPETYWMAKALTSANEREFVGIIRMLNSGASEAFNFLQKHGYNTADAIDLMSQLTKLSRSDAAQFTFNKIQGTDRARLFDLVYGAGEPLPAYVYLYNDLIDQNLAITLMANWDFRKARTLKQKNQKLSLKFSLQKTLDLVRTASVKYAKDTSRLISMSDFGVSIVKELQAPTTPTSFDRYVDHVLQVAGPVWRYLPEVNESSRDEHVVLFSNGMELFEETLRVVMVSPASDTDRYEPLSVFYEQDDGQLIEKFSFEQKRVDISVLIWNEDGRYRAVLADRRLLQSMMFRMYYLRGRGLKYINPKFEKSDSSSNTRISIFEINWKNLEGGSEYA